MFRRKNSEVEKNRELEESKETVTCAICVDYFEDARQLSCSHSFCLACLVSFQSDKHGSSPCPTCRKISVPPLAQLQSLPINSFANGLAELIRQQENPPTTIAGGSGDTGRSVTGSINSDETDVFVGQMIKEPSRPPPQTIKPWHAGLVLAVGALTGGIGGFLAGAAISGMALGSGKIKQQIDKRAKEMYNCCACGEKVYDLDRYRCGMCRDDFTVCPKCFRNGSILRRHSPNHVFLLLPCKPKRFLPDMPLLKPIAKELPESYVYGGGTAVHGKSYIHTPERLIKQDGIMCQVCRTKPITGNRYKCGFCWDYDLCSRCYEKKSHDPTHVFLVLMHSCEINIVKEPLLKVCFY